METIIARERPYLVLPQPYWHATPRRGAQLLHNVHNGEGICWSISAIRSDGLESAVTFYGALNRHQDKEQAWEDVRKTKFPHLPTRQHALFLFDDEILAKKICQSWFGDQGRVLVEARIVAGATVHRADAKLLNGGRDEWPELAAQYWNGDMTDDPSPEIILCGAAYFPGWRQPPFGLFAGMLPEPPTQG